MRAYAAAMLVSLVAALAFATPQSETGDSLNRRGFASLEKGEIKRAHGLFVQATRRDPRLAFAWLNLARTTTLGAKNDAPNPSPLARANTNIATSRSRKTARWTGPTRLSSGR